MFNRSSPSSTTVMMEESRSVGASKLVAAWLDLDNQSSSFKRALDGSARREFAHRLEIGSQRASAMSGECYSVVDSAESTTANHVTRYCHMAIVQPAATPDELKLIANRRASLPKIDTDKWDEAGAGINEYELFHAKLQGYLVSTGFIQVFDLPDPSDAAACAQYNTDKGLPTTSQKAYPEPVDADTWNEFNLFLFNDVMSCWSGKVFDNIILKVQNDAAPNSGKKVIELLADKYRPVKLVNAISVLLNLLKTQYTANSDPQHLFNTVDALIQRLLNMNMLVRATSETFNVALTTFIMSKSPDYAGTLDSLLSTPVAYWCCA